MARKVCKVCDTPGAAVTVNAGLDNCKRLCDISDELALQNPPIFITKSSVHRHSQNCYTKRMRAEKRKEELRRNHFPGKIIVLWPEGCRDVLTGPSDRRGESYRPYTPEEIGPNDVLLVVQYETWPLQEIPNARALITDDLLHAAHQENAERFSAKENPEPAPE